MRFELAACLIAGLAACSASDDQIVAPGTKVELTNLVGHRIEPDHSAAPAVKVGVSLDKSIRVADEVMPGGMVIGEAPADSEISIDGKVIRQTGDGRFVFGVGRDAKGEVELRIKRPDGEQALRKIAVAKRDYEIQRIDGLPARKVQPNKDDQAKIEADWILLNKAKGVNRALDAFAGEAVWPVVGPISGVFGSQRILNGKPRSPHRGVDVAAPKGTPVGTMLNGVVTVASPDMYYTGGTVMVDHGHGIQSLYAHLSKIDVEVGQELAKGDQVGLIGATGRATGPHLHLSLYWFETALDPALVLGPMPKIEEAGSRN